MNSRTNILSALRKATQEWHVDYQPVPADLETFSDIPEVDLATVFAERLGELSGETFRVKTADAVGAMIMDLTEGRSICACPGLKSVLADDMVTWFDGDMSNSDLEKFEVVVTGAAALVARTGSVILKSDAVGRRASTLAPFHIVIAPEDKLVPSLEQAIIAKNLSGSTVIISGPARTADIEKILVLGAHGPKRLAVIIITSADATVSS